MPARPSPARARLSPRASGGASLALSGPRAVSGWGVRSRWRWPRDGMFGGQPAVAGRLLQAREAMLVNTGHAWRPHLEATPGGHTWSPRRASCPHGAVTCLRHQPSF